MTNPLSPVATHATQQLSPDDCTTPDAVHAPSSATSVVSCQHCGEELHIAGSGPDDWDEDDEQMRQFEDGHAGCGRAEAEHFVADVLKVTSFLDADLPLRVWQAAIDVAQRTVDLDREDRRDEVSETVARLRRALAVVSAATPDPADWREKSLSVTWGSWPLPSNARHDLGIDIYGYYSPTSSSPAAIVVGDAEITVTQLRQLRDNCDQALEVAELLGLS